MSDTKTRERPAMALPTLPPTEVRALAKTVAKEAGGTKISAYFEANKDSLRKLLPQHMTADRFLRVTLNALRTTPKLLDCTLESLFGATVFCAQIGLEPNTPQGHIYLIPFKNNRKNRTEVQVIVGYQGLISLARRTGEIESIMAQAVYARDTFNFDYLRPEELTHKPFLNGDRGELIGAYAMARFKDGGQAFDFMPRADIEKIRDGSQGYKRAIQYKGDSPWLSHFDQMARKTAVRRLSKYLPMSIEMAGAVALDERGERRMSQRFDKILEAGDFDMSLLSGEEDGAPQDGAAEGPADGDEQQQGSGEQQPQQIDGTAEEAGASSAGGAEGSGSAAGEEGAQGASAPADDPAERRDDPPPPAEAEKTKQADPPQQAKAQPPKPAPKKPDAPKGGGLNFD